MDSASSAIANPHPLLLCPLCKDLFQDARFLPCFHSFCASCLSDRLLQSAGQTTTTTTLSCPSCAAVCDLPANGILGLVPNNTLNQLVQSAATESAANKKSTAAHSESLLHRSPPPTSKKRTLDAAISLRADPCDLHSSADADSSGSFASSAKVGHLPKKSVQATEASVEGRGLSEVSQMSPSPSPYSASVSTDAAEMCSEHRVALRYVCSECDALVCGECAVEKHQTHRIIRISKAVHEEVSQLQKQADISLQTLKRLEEIEARIKTDICLCDDNCRKLESDIRTFCEKLISKVREREKELLKELGDVQNQKLLELTSLSEKVKQLQDSIRETLTTNKVMEHLKNHESKQTWQELQEVRKAKAQVMSSISSSESLMKAPLPQAALFFIQNENKSIPQSCTNSIETTVSGFGHICQSAECKHTSRQGEMDSDDLFTLCDHALEKLQKSECHQSARFFKALIAFDETFIPGLLGYRLLLMQYPTLVPRPSATFPIRHLLRKARKAPPEARATAQRYFETRQQPTSTRTSMTITMTTTETSTETLSSDPTRQAIFLVLRGDFLLHVLEQHDEGFQLYRRAADLHYAPAQHRVGNFFRFGDTVGQDEAEAANWYRLAAEQGYAPAQSNLGYYYIECGHTQGQRTASVRQAVALYRKAAQQGFAPAQHCLGTCYRDGFGIEQDDEQAEKWLRQAADAGYWDAISSLREMGVSYP